MAEDGRYYERSAIEQWLETATGGDRSPVTSWPMGRVLKAGIQVRNTIKLMVETGAISGGKADAWKLRIEEEAEVARTMQRCKDGDRNAMLFLGFMHRDGENGLTADPAQAFMWFKQAADLDDLRALSCVGHMCYQGHSVQKKSMLGAVCLGKAATLGSEHACYLLGRFYGNGLHDFDQDSVQTAFWYKKMPTCAVESSSDDCREKAARWLRTHSVYRAS